MEIVDLGEHLDPSQADQLVASLEARLKEDPADLKALLLLGNCHYLAGRISQSIDVFRRVIQLNPATSQAYYYLGVALYRSGRVEEAIQVLLELTGRWPSLVMGNYWLGIACYHQGEYGASRKAFETLLQHSPESKIAHYHAALACFADKAYERARDHLLVMVNEGYRDPQVYQLLGRVYRRLQRYPEAVETYKKGLALNPDNGPLKLSLEDLTDVQDP